MIFKVSGITFFLPTFIFFPSPFFFFPTQMTIILSSSIIYVHILLLISHTVLGDFIGVGSSGNTNNNSTIIDILVEQNRFQILVDYLNKTELIPYVNDLESATLFAPDDTAFEHYQGPEIDKHILLYHFIQHGQLSQDFFHGQLLTSNYERPNLLGPKKKHNGQRIKVTKDGKLGKGGGKIYINQAQITTQDIQVNNKTYIHAIDQVLAPPVMLDVLLRQQYQSYFDIMALAGINSTVSQGKPFTVFVTKADPLAKFNSIEHAYLSSPLYGGKDLQSYLNYMVLYNDTGPNYAVDMPTGKSTYKTANGESITIDILDDGKIMVNDKQMIQSDILAANGVVHELKDIPIPDTLFFDSRKYLYGLNATKFVTLLDRFGLGDYLDDSKKYGYTFLAPENDAIDENTIPNHIKRDWLNYHISNSTWTKDSLSDGMMLVSQFASKPMGGALQRIPVYVDSEEVFASKPGKSIRFDHSRVITSVDDIRGDSIYKISDPLKIPGDMLSQLVVDLDLSTFIATLYVSELADEIRQAKGITLFVPTNDAFIRLGLLAKYFVHPTGKQHLQTVLRYHAAQELLYYDDMMNHVSEVPTLAKSMLRIRATQDKQHVVVGRPDGSDANAGNILMSNGVVHKLTDVQIPGQVKITNYDLLVGIGATTMVKVLERANMTDVLNASDCVVLAPTDKAFAHVDLDNLYNDPYQLDRIARFHLLKTTWRQDVLNWQSDYQTYLSGKDKVIIKKETENDGGDDDLIVVVKDKESMTAQVTGLGKVTAGGGGVLEINTVLLPIRRGVFGLPFAWSIVVLVTIVMIVSSIIGVCGFFTYKIYNRRRLGYRAV
ncbi:FAS1 domain-containing protein [Absidia repens]|uniref:FAS1 domain-containing protein n=1 Tax=Absidia repens TaxID=90262 RepID=A0A1X2IHN9_9FUNG|nr:FAS1 domain-containing protein [Absidia repens]